MKEGKSQFELRFEAADWSNVDAQWEALDLVIKSRCGRDDKLWLFYFENN